MNNSDASPVVPSAPGQTQPADAGLTQKVSLNPFAHFRAGAGAFVKTNLTPAVIAILISAVANTILTAAFLYLFFTRGFMFLGGPSLQPGGGELVQLIVTVVALAVLAALIVGFFGSVVNRLIVTGSRGQKEDFGSAFNFVLKRLSKIVLTYLLVFGIFIGGALIIGVLGAVSPILGVLLSIAGIVAAIVFALRIAYIPLILVDNNDPGKPMDVIKRSAAFWSKSQWALVLYILAWLVVYIIFSLFSDSADRYSPGAGSLSPAILPGAFSFAIGSALLSSLLSNIFGVLVYCGQSSIYDDAGKIIGGVTSATSSASPRAPQ